MYKILFDGYPPELGAVAKKVEALSGLAVLATPSGPEAENLFYLHGTLAFAAFPEESLEIYCYRLGAVRKWTEEESAGQALLPELGPAVQGYDEEPGTRVVYVEVYFGTEPTLPAFILRALEALGGTPERPLHATLLAPAAQPLTPQELAVRKARHARQMAPLRLFLVLSTPLLLVVWDWRQLRRNLNEAREHIRILRGETETGRPAGRLAQARAAMRMLPYMAAGAIVSVLGSVALIVAAPFFLVYLVYGVAKYAFYRLARRRAQ